MSFIKFQSSVCHVLIGLAHPTSQPLASLTSALQILVLVSQPPLSGQSVRTWHRSDPLWIENPTSRPLLLLLLHRWPLACSPLVWSAEFVHVLTARQHLSIPPCRLLHSRKSGACLLCPTLRLPGEPIKPGAVVVRCF